MRSTPVLSIDLRRGSGHERYRNRGSPRGRGSARIVSTRRTTSLTCGRSCSAGHRASDSTVRSSGLPAPVTVAARDQPSGGSGARTATSSARWAATVRNEGGAGGGADADPGGAGRGVGSRRRGACGCGEGVGGWRRHAGRVPLSGPFLPARGCGRELRRLVGQDRGRGAARRRRGKEGERAQATPPRRRRGPDAEGAPPSGRRGRGREAAARRARPGLRPPGAGLGRWVPGVAPRAHPSEPRRG